MNMDRAMLLKEVQKTSFAVTEATLYLDTHPGCESAIRYFENARQNAEDSINEYERYFGALTVNSVDTSGGMWTWNNEPMPWQI